MNAQTYNKKVVGIEGISPCMTYAMVFDELSLRGYDIIICRPFANTKRWMAEVCYRIDETSEVQRQVKDEDGEWMYCDDWEDIAIKAIKFALKIIERHRKDNIKILLPTYN